MRRFKYIILIAAVIFGFAFYWLQLKIEKKSNLSEIDNQKMLGSIKKIEAEQPPRIGKSPSDAEIYNNSYIKQIRIALDGYLDGTNTGVEIAALNATSEEMKCGLNNFSKSYYQSKFVILNAYDNDYGGVQAYITFINKPDTVFWVWIYQMGGNDGEYVLRTICEKPFSSAEEKSVVNEIIKNSQNYF